MKVAARGACREWARLGIIADYNAEILEAYWRVGFYVFTGMLTADELADLEVDVEAARPATRAQYARREGHR